MRIIRENYLQAFSPQFLFLYGEPSSLKLQYSLLTSGELYIIELPFLLTGLLALFKLRKNRLALYLLLIGPLPSTFNSDQSYINRSIMMLPFLEIIVAEGITFAYDALKKSKRKSYLPLVVGLVTTIFLFLIGEYLYTYYFRYPFFGAEGWLESSRQAALFAGDYHTKYNDVFITSPEQMFLLQYGVWNKIEPTIIHTAWVKYQNGTSRVGNVHFLISCPLKTTFLTTKNTLFITPHECVLPTAPMASIADRAEVLRKIWDIRSN